MQIHVQVGDVLAAAADALISTANPWLNLSGGVNGAILAATGPAIQEELHAYLESEGIGRAGWNRRPKQFGEPAIRLHPACGCDRPVLRFDR